ncbi:YdiY family protein [Candidatus Omnitrophota bacterium]
MKVRYLTFSAIAIFMLLNSEILFADQVYLKNGDRISGNIIKREDNSTLLKTESLGELSINDREIERIEEDASKKEPKVKIEPKREEAAKPIWKREIHAGYNRVTGNTHAGELSTGLFINRNRKHVDEYTLKGDLYYSSSQRKMNAQRSSGMVRYAFSFGPGKRLYNFYKFEADHDRFANVDYRLLPSAGLGLWIFDEEDTKILVEAAAGWEHTDYRDNTKDRDEGVFIPRAFLEKKFFKSSKITQDIYLYPTFEDFNQYRLHSETVFTQAINNKLSLNLSLIDDYNSGPAKDTKKNDLRLTSSLKYSF